MEKCEDYNSTPNVPTLYFVSVPSQYDFGFLPTYY